MPNQEVVCRLGFLWVVMPMFLLMHGRLVQALPSLDLVSLTFEMNPRLLMQR